LSAEPGELVERRLRIELGVLELRDDQRRPREIDRLFTQHGLQFLRQSHRSLVQAHSAATPARLIAR